MNGDKISSLFIQLNAAEEEYLDFHIKTSYTSLMNYNTEFPINFTGVFMKNKNVQILKYYNIIDQVLKKINHMV